jgi:hypothetical protein
LIASAVGGAFIAPAFAHALVARGWAGAFLATASLAAALIGFFVPASDLLILLPDIGVGAFAFRHVVLIAALALLLTGLVLVLTLFGIHDVLLRLARRDCRRLLE